MTVNTAFNFTLKNGRFFGQKDCGRRIKIIERKQLEKHDLIAGVPVLNGFPTGIGKRMRMGNNHPIGQHVRVPVFYRTSQHQKINRDKQQSQN